MYSGHPGVRPGYTIADGLRKTVLDLRIEGRPADETVCGGNHVEIG